MAANPANPNGDFPVQSPPTDSVSALAWSPVANHLAAASWDNQVRVWEVLPSGQAVPRAMYAHQAPVLCAAWHQDGQHVFSGSCDQTVLMYNVGTKQQRVVAKHDAPVKTVQYVPEIGQLVTGSWDRTLRYWDLRQQQATCTVQLPERVYAVDVAHPLAVVACANRKMLIYHLSKPTVPYREFDSPLKMQTRCIATFPDKTGFAVGSIEGRVAIHHVQDKNPKNFAFKCHRVKQEVYAVNSINFHPRGTFATAGADGVFVLWDKERKQRLRMFAACNNPITAAAFNRDGSIYAYATGYDWSKGAQYYDKSKPPQVLLHAIKPAEMQPRQGR